MTRDYQEAGLIDFRDVDAEVWPGEPGYKAPDKDNPAEDFTEFFQPARREKSEKAKEISN